MLEQDAPTHHLFYSVLSFEGGGGRGDLTPTHTHTYSRWNAYRDKIL